MPLPGLTVFNLTYLLIGLYNLNPIYTKISFSGQKNHFYQYIT